MAKSGQRNELALVVFRPGNRLTWLLNGESIRK